MAITNYERVGKAMDLLKEGLGPFVEREFTNCYKDEAGAEAIRYLGDDRLLAKKAITEWDAAGLLKLMWEAWNDVFRRTLGPADRSLVSELRDLRNKWAHQQTFSGDDAYRAFDSAGRLLAAVSAPQSDEIEKMKMELLRLRFDEQMRSEKRKSASTAIESAAATNLKPWREVVTPHRDVASGRYQQAEFAADLWQVHMGEGTDEYKKPVEFFRRTYLTDSLKQMLIDKFRRWQNALDAGTLPSLLWYGPERTRRHRGRPPGSRHQEASDGEARGIGGQQDLTRQPREEGRRNYSAYALGRARLAAWWKEGIRTRPRRR
jgi:hypothetical protein